MENKITLEYYVLDVFTTKSYKGNPLSVVFTNGNLELEQYEKIAREFGYSETSFVYYSNTKKALIVRSFTPTGFEVDGAGHNLLGAVGAALLKKMEIFQEQSASHFVIMKETPIPILIDFEAKSKLPIVKMKQKTATTGESIPAAIIAKAIGLSTEDLEVPNFIPTIVQTEVAHLMVPIKNIETLDKIKTDNNHLIAISKQHNFEGFYCFAFTGDEKTIVQSRFFNPLIGIDEDAATGTAAGPLAGLLNKQNIIQSNKEYQILQGVQLNQPSLLKVMVNENNVLVGGSSVITMEGKIYLD